METDGSLLVKFFTYTIDKGYWLNEEVMYTINVDDVVREIEPPILKQISKRRGWVIFKDKELNVLSESYSDFSIWKRNIYAVSLSKVYIYKHILQQMTDFATDDRSRECCCCLVDS